MTSRIFALIAVFSTILLVAAAPAPAGATTASQFKDQIAKTNLRLLARYIEEGAVMNGDAFPVTVSRGDYSLYAWPRNPWTGLPMSQGTVRGDYNYAQLDGGLSYTISTRLSNRHVFTLTKSPFTALAHAIRVALKNEVAKQSLHVLRGYVDMWATLNDGVTPVTGDMTAAGLATVTNDYWPTNPFTSAPLATSGDLGDFSYVRGPDGVTYQLSAHLDGSDYTIDGSAPQTIPDAFHSLKNELVKADVDRIACAIDAYARANAGTYPDVAEVDHAGSVATYLDPWPTNPFVAGFMEQGTLPGEFTYVKSGGGYTLTGFLWGGTEYIVP